MSDTAPCTETQPAPSALRVFRDVAKVDKIIQSAHRRWLVIHSPAAGSVRIPLSIADATAYHVGQEVWIQISVEPHV